jgi:hypothetical protein
MRAKISETGWSSLKVAALVPRTALTTSSWEPLCVVWPTRDSLTAKNWPQCPQFAVHSDEGSIGCLAPRITPLFDL